MTSKKKSKLHKFEIYIHSPTMDHMEIKRELWKSIKNFISQKKNEDTCTLHLSLTLRPDFARTKYRTISLDINTEENLIGVGSYFTKEIYKMQKIKEADYFTKMTRIKFVWKEE